MNTIENNMEEAWELITKGINAGAWDWDIKSGTNWWSSHYYSLLGYDNLELEANYHNFFNVLVHPDDKERAEIATEAHLKEGKPFIVELRLKTKSGNYRWFETSGSCKRDDNGVPVRMAGIVVDRHEQIMLRKELELSEYLLNETGRLGKIAGWELKAGSEEAYMSKAGYEIYGFTNGVLPPVDERLKLIPNEHIVEMQWRLKQCIEEGVGYEMEHGLALPDGTKKWVFVRAVPVLGKNGKVEVVRGVTQDITELKAKRDELLKANNTVQEQNKRLLNFARIVSHDLTSHCGNLVKVSEIFEEADSDEERLEMIGLIKKISGSLISTISGLSSVVKAQTEIETQRTKISLTRIYASVLTVLSQEIKEKGATINADFSACPEVDYVLPYMESIMLNFTTNALKYSHPGRKPEISIRSVMVDGKPALEFKDNGQGIDLERYGKDLFGMYKTFHGNVEARGIGLFITKSQVDSLGGNIEVESQPDRGTTFMVTL